MNSSRHSTGEPPNPKTFEQLLVEIESILADLEGGKLGLNDSLQRYEVGVRHVAACLKILDEAERRVALVTRIQADGRPETEPLTESSGTLEEKAKVRSKRRSATTPPGLFDTDADA